MLVLLYPYLPLRGRQSVGPWELVPARNLEDDDAPTPEAARAIRGLVELYELPEDLGQFGALAKPAGGLVGDEFERQAMRALGRALVVALLAGNPSLLTPEEERSGNEGHMMLTSDNAIGYGHPLGEDGYVAVEEGAIATVLRGGLNVFRPGAKISTPIEVRAPMLSRELDGELADAVHQVLTAETADARRLGRAIDWLDLAWRNTSSINRDLRLAALKSAFEILFDSGDVAVLRQRLSALLDPEHVERTERRWVDRRGRERVQSMSDLEWWFTNFAFLRNAILHGDDLDGDDYLFENGREHLWLADARLREAIIELDARAGHPEIRLDPFARELRRAYRESGFDLDAD